MLLSGQIAPEDKVWRKGMDGSESAAPFLWFAARGAERSQSQAAPAPAPEQAIEAKPRPALYPPSAATLGKLEQPGKKVVGKLLGREVSVAEADLAGPNAEPYLAFRQKLINKGGRVWFSWSWSAFFVPIAWLAYRRLFSFLFFVSVIMSIAVAVVGVLSMAFKPLALLNFAVLAYPFAMAMIAKRLVLIEADKAAAMADAAGVAPANRPVLVAAQGGVSRAGAWLGAVLYALLVGMAVLNSLAKYPSGFPRVWQI